MLDCLGVPRGQTSFLPVERDVSPVRKEPRRGIQNNRHVWGLPDFQSHPTVFKILPCEPGISFELSLPVRFYFASFLILQTLYLKQCCFLSSLTQWVSDFFTVFSQIPQGAE